MKISVDLVDKIERPWSEKQRFVVSRIADKAFGFDVQGQADTSEVKE